MNLVACARLLCVSLAIIGLGSDQAVAACLNYEPAVVTVSGTVTMQQAYGAPNYGEDPEHDDIEIYPLLALDSVACVDATPGDPLDPAESGLTDMQMVFVDPSDAFKTEWIGKHVTITGRLFHANTGHDRTPVLIEPSKIVLTQAPEMKPRSRPGLLGGGN